jgi:hypothetical protein
VFVQVDDVAYAPAAALVGAGPVALAGGAEVRAADVAPAGWTDCGAPDPAPAAAVAAPALVPAPTAHVSGAVTADPGAWAAAGERFGELDRSGLVARADLVVPAGGSYVPAPPVAGEFPVVHVRGAGETELRGPARLQGTLLVDGGLTVVGRVEVAGLVVVGGTLAASDGALVVDGAVVGRGAASLGPGSAVRRSRCALDRAAAGASRPAPLARRAWSEVVR